MAKDINDNEPESEVTPATGGEIRGMLTRYENLNEEKASIAESQKTMLKEFDTNHGFPPWVAKIIRRFDKIEDLGNRSHAWNALIRAGKEMGFDQQPDMFDGKSAPDPERPRRARAMA